MYSVKGHKEIINTIDGVGGLGIGEGAPEIVTGSRDGKSEYSVYVNFFLLNLCAAIYSMWKSSSVLDPLNLTLYFF